MVKPDDLEGRRRYNQQFTKIFGGLRDKTWIPPKFHISYSWKTVNNDGTSHVYSLTKIPSKNDKYHKNSCNLLKTIKLTTRLKAL